MISEAQKRAIYKDKANNTVQLRLELRKTTDSDVIEKLESVPNKSQYIKALIRADIANSSSDEQERG